MSIKDYSKPLKFIIFPGWTLPFPMVVIPARDIDLFLLMISAMPITAILDYFGFTVTTFFRYIRSKTIGQYRHIRSPWRHFK